MRQSPGKNAGSGSSNRGNRPATPSFIALPFAADLHRSTQMLVWAICAHLRLSAANDFVSNAPRMNTDEHGYLEQHAR
jgi:hypothetical protein